MKTTICIFLLSLVLSSEIVRATEADSQAGPKNVESNEAAKVNGTVGNVQGLPQETTTPPTTITTVSPNTTTLPPPTPAPNTTTTTTLPPPTPAPNTTTTTTLPPPTPAPKTTTTTLPPPPPPPPNSTTTVPPPTTTPIPVSTSTAAPITTTTPDPARDRKFDGPSFIGGMVLTIGLTAIGFVAFKFYKSRTERNYHTL